ncbi:MAG: response regulator, partial [Chthoniobacterales bacterium]
MAKILIVDDDAAFRGGLAETLSDLGHECIEAESGRAALAQIQAAKFALIFLDLRMRGLDGLETLRELRELPHGSNAPVVMLTAHAGSDNTIEAMKLGAFDHLAKPIGREQVRAVLERALASAPKGKVAEASGGADDRLLGASAGMRE